MQVFSIIYAGSLFGGQTIIDWIKNSYTRFKKNARKDVTELK